MSYHRLSPVQLDAFIHPVRKLLAQGYMNEALCRARSLTRALPYYESLWGLLAQVQWQMGLLPEAEVSLKRGLALAPKNPSLYFHLGFVYKLQGHVQQAIGQFRQAAALNPANVTYRDALEAAEMMLPPEA